MPEAPNISVWTGVGYDMDPGETVAMLRECGYRHTELSHAHGSRLFGNGQARAFRKTAEDLGMSIPQGHAMLGIDIAGTDDAVRLPLLDKLKKWLDMYAELGIGLCVLHPGWGEDIYRGADPSAVKAARTQVLAGLMEHSRDMPVTLCLENLADVGARAQDLLDMIALTGMDNAGVCLDTGHLNLAGGDPAEFIRTCGKKLRMVHLNDNTGPHNPDRSTNLWTQPDDLHLLPVAWEGNGKGSLNWRAIADALRESGFAGPYNFEIGGEVWGNPPSVRRLKLDYAKKLAQGFFGTA